MSTLYVIENSEENPLVDKNFLSNYYEPGVKAKIDKLKTELTKEITQSYNAAIEAAKGEIKQQYESAIEQAKSEVQIKASDTEPAEAAENTVWFDIKNKLIKVKVGGSWVPMGAVYQ